MNRNKLIKGTLDLFMNRYSKGADLISLAPGRINIIGEHTDYNGGLAMPAAIDMYVCVALKRNSQKLLNAYSVNLDKTFSSELDDDFEGDLWIKYVKGTVYEIYKKYNIKEGVDILINSSLSMGSGLSSSAALEVSISNGLVALFEIDSTDKEIIKLCQKVDHDHIKIKSGTLDQSASQLSRDGSVLKLDFGKNTHEYIENNCSNCSWIIVDSMIKRELANSKYHERVLECDQALKIIRESIGDKRGFNDIRSDDLSKIMSPESISYKRAKHIIDENSRVQKMERFLCENNLKKIGELLSQSHQSLRDNYQVSCIEIDYLIELSSSFPSWYGGRIMGGGFGGNVISLIKKGHEKEYAKHIRKKYLDKFKKNPKIRTVRFVGGAEIVDNISAD